MPLKLQWVSHKLQWDPFFCTGLSPELHFGTSQVTLGYLPSCNGVHWGAPHTTLSVFQDTNLHIVKQWGTSQVTMGCIPSCASQVTLMHPSVPPIPPTKF